MKAALIAPTGLLQDVQSYSRYHLILTHKVIYDSRYCNFYKERSKAGDYVILDNSAVEKRGKAVPMKNVALAAFLVRPAVVFLPDFLFDAEGTLDEIENALRSPHVKMMLRFMPGVKFAAVVQGLDKAEWLECFKILDSIKGIEILGIPMLTAKLFGSRLECLEIIARKAKHTCHLLGAMDNLETTIAQAKFPFVMGIDTSKPVRLAVSGMRLEQWSELGRDREFMDRRCNGADPELLKYNCERFVALCGGEQ